MPYNNYEGVEAPDNFADDRAVSQYRAAVLERSKVHAEFITRCFPDACTILESCCGNGRLLIALADRFESLYGFDASKSRVAFGKSWIEDSGYTNIDLWSDNAMAPSARLLGLKVDLGICITGAFGYFEAFEEGISERLMQIHAAQINTGGGLLLELYQHPHEIAACLQDSHMRR